MGLYRRIQHALAQGLLELCMHPVTVSATLTYAGLQAEAARRGAYDMIVTAPERIAFGREFDIPLTGNFSEPRETRLVIDQLSTALRGEQSRPAAISRIHIEPEVWYLKSPREQVIRTLFSDYAGYYIGGLMGIAQTGDTIEHEIKHAQTSAVLKRRPDFEQRWNTVAHRGSDDPYLNSREQIYSHVRLLKSLVPSYKRMLHVAQRNGFVSPYARTNWFEDVAETGSTGLRMLSSCATPPELHPAVNDKIALLQEFGLIPTEFQAYEGIEKKYCDVWNWRSVDLEKARHFLAASDVFLNQYPASAYVPEIRYQRGRAQEPQSSAEHEFRAGMCASDVDPSYIAPFLGRIATLRVYNSDFAGYHRFTEAKDNFDRGVSGRSIIESLRASGESFPCR